MKGTCIPMAAKKFTADTNEIIGSDAVIGRFVERHEMLVCIQNHSFAADMIVILFQAVRVAAWLHYDNPAVGSS